ncbi:MAG: hypothetical protein GWN30_27590 [Gammaproteobacteria bacterium]|nr:hypothetical protein [Gammaproteobacteria bacterium]
MFENTFLTTGSLLETEHGLVMLLILYGLLTYRGEKLSRWVAPVIVVGVLLSVFTPVHEVTLFWPVITGLVVPPFLWQGAVAITKSGQLRSRLNLLVWFLTIFLVTFSLLQFSGLPLSNALLLGILAVTLVWYVRERNVDRTYLSTLGLIALVVLLVEVDLAVVSLRFWLRNLVSGAAIGFGLGFLGVYLYRKFRKHLKKNYFFFAWAYLTYLVGILLGTSAIATTLAAALVVAIYGFSIGLWITPRSIPVPSKSPFFFYLASFIWIILGWQANTTVEISEFGGILAAMAVITAGILVARRMAPISSENSFFRLVRKEVRVFLLLLGSVLFWPDQAFLTTISVEIALAAAILLVILLRYSIQPVFDLMGVQLSWPSETKEINEDEVEQ